MRRSESNEALQDPVLRKQLVAEGRGMISDRLRQNANDPLGSSTRDVRSCLTGVTTRLSRLCFELWSQGPTRLSY